MFHAHSLFCSCSLTKNANISFLSLITCQFCKTSRWWVIGTLSSYYPDHFSLKNRSSVASHMGWFLRQAEGCQWIGINTSASPHLKTELMPGKSRLSYRSQSALTLEKQELAHSLLGTVDIQKAVSFLAWYPDMSKGSPYPKANFFFLSPFWYSQPSSWCN